MEDGENIFRLIRGEHRLNLAARSLSSQSASNPFKLFAGPMQSASLNNSQVRKAGLPPLFLFLFVPFRVSSWIGFRSAFEISCFSLFTLHSELVRKAGLPPLFLFLFVSFRVSSWIDFP
jgi:hypothetical protein